MKQSTADGLKVILTVVATALAAIILAWMLFGCDDLEGRGDGDDTDTDADTDTDTVAEYTSPCGDSDCADLGIIAATCLPTGAIVTTYYQCSNGGGSCSETVDITTSCPGECVDAEHGPDYCD